MKPIFTVSVCLLACSLLTGCAHVSNTSSQYCKNALVYLHIRNTPAEPEEGQVCILDPVAAAEQMAGQPAAAGDKSPAVMVPETTYDFGKITEEKEVSHEFSVKNVGKAVLNIKKVLPG